MPQNKQKHLKNILKMTYKVKQMILNKMQKNAEKNLKERERPKRETS